MVKNYTFVFLIFFSIAVGSKTKINAQELIDLNLEKAVDIAMKKSYRIRLLEMGVRKSELRLNASKAELQTQIFMNLKTPDLENVSESKWDSNLGRDIIVRQNTKLWQSELSVLQPIILFGFPTNGSLSLNYKLYQYQQNNEGLNQTDFYNRLYLKLKQPFFLPNSMKNNLERAELDLKYNQLSFLSNQMNIMEDIADDYYDLFELSYKKKIYQDQISTLQDLFEISSAASWSDSKYKLDKNQIQLEINNIREELLSNQSEFRRRIANIKQKLRLNSEDTISVKPDVSLNPIHINLDQAIEYGLKNNPDLQRVNINKKRSEINLENQKGQNAFNMTLEVTYGLEKKNDKFQNLWEQFYNSNSVTLNAYLPIWDGGVRNYRVKADELNILQKDLQIVEEKEDIRKNINNSFTSMNEFYNRAVTMKESIGLAEKIANAKIQQYSESSTSLIGILQTIERVASTKNKFIEVYLDYRKSLLDLMTVTYYDFEKDISLLNAFKMKSSPKEKNN